MFRRDSWIGKIMYKMGGGKISHRQAIQLSVAGH